MSKRTRTLWALGAYLLMFGLTTVLFWDVMRDTILVPVYYVLWVLGLLLNSVSQSVYMLLFILLCLFIGVRVFDDMPGRPRASRTSFVPVISGTRYRLWSLLCADAPQNWFSKGRLAIEARKLILSTLAFERGVGIAEIEQMVRNGTLALPDTIREIVVTRYISDPPLSSRIIGPLKQLRMLLSRTPATPDPYVEQLIAELISFIEIHLEMPHAGKNPDS